MSLLHRPALQTVSKACLKSMKQHNNFFLLDWAMPIRLLRINRLSVVEKCFLKPACSPPIRLVFSAYLFNLLLIIAVKVSQSCLRALLVYNSLDSWDCLCF